MERVFGKAGRADTSTDPAPFSMIETTVVLKPEAEWRFLPLVFRPAGVLESAVAGCVAGKTLLRATGRRNGSKTPVSRRDQRLDHADQGAHRHADDGRAHAHRHQDLWRRYQNKIEGLGTPGEHPQRYPGNQGVYAERIGGGYFVDFDLKKRIGPLRTIRRGRQMVIMSAIERRQITARPSKAGRDTRSTSAMPARSGRISTRSNGSWSPPPPGPRSRWRRSRISKCVPARP